MATCAYFWTFLKIESKWKVLSRCLCFFIKIQTCIQAVKFCFIEVMYTEGFGHERAVFFESCIISLDVPTFFFFLPFVQTRLARGASLRVSIGDIADLLELSPREIEELRKVHNDPKPKEVRRTSDAARYIV